MPCRQVKRKKADSARKELAAQRGAGGARVENAVGGGAGKAAPAGGTAAAKLRNPKAFVYSGRGKAKKAASRTAEREQRRMHGEQPLQVMVDPQLPGPAPVLFRPEKLWIG